jgi:hypothetical protein
MWPLNTLHKKVKNKIKTRIFLRGRGSSVPVKYPKISKNETTKEEHDLDISVVICDTDVV